MLFLFCLICAAFAQNTCDERTGTNFCKGSAGPPVNYKCCASNFMTGADPCVCVDGSTCADCQATIKPARSATLAACTAAPTATPTNVTCQVSSDSKTYCCTNSTPNAQRIYSSPPSCACNDNSACTDCSTYAAPACDVAQKKCKDVFGLRYCCPSGSLTISTFGGGTSCSCADLGTACTNCAPADVLPDPALTTLPTPTVATCNTLTEKCTSQNNQLYCCPTSADIVIKLIGGVDTCGCYSGTTETACSKCTAQQPAPQPSGPTPAPADAEIVARSFASIDCSGAPGETFFFKNDPADCQAQYFANFGNVFFKGYCENGHMTGDICSDAACTSCTKFPNFNSQNICGQDFAGRLSSNYQCFTSVPGPTPPSNSNATVPEAIVFHAYMSDDCSGEEVESVVFDNNIEACQAYSAPDGTGYFKAYCDINGFLNASLCSDDQCTVCTPYAVGTSEASCTNFIGGNGTATYECLAERPSSGLSPGAIAGIVIGVIIGVIIVAAAIFFVASGNGPVESV